MKENKREREKERDPEAGRKDRIYRDWKPRILKKKEIEGGGGRKGRCSRLAVRECSLRHKLVQKDTTRATFACERRIALQRESSDCC